MKTANSKLIIFAAVVAVVVVAAGTYLSLANLPTSSGYVSPSFGGAETPALPPSDEPAETVVKNQYPIPAVNAAYGGLQRVGSSKNDRAEQVYALGDYIYLIFYSEKNDFDSGEKNSVNMAKLDKNGAVLKTALLGKAEYVASKPVWNGIAVCLSDGGGHNSLVFTDFELEICATRSVSAGAAELYFYKEKLFFIAAAEGILSLAAFDADFGLAAAANASVAKDCSVKAAFGLSELKIILTSPSAFYVYTYGENPTQKLNSLNSAYKTAETYTKTSLNSAYQNAETYSKTSFSSAYGNTEICPLNSLNSAYKNAETHTKTSLNSAYGNTEIRPLNSLNSAYKNAETHTKTSLNSAYQNTAICPLNSLNSAYKNTETHTKTSLNSAYGNAEICPLNSLNSAYKNTETYTKTYFSSAYAAENSQTLFKTADGLGGADVVIPKKDGYVFIGKNSGIIRLYNSDFIKTDEKNLGGVISGIEPTPFGYVVTSKTDGGSEVFFLCPHFDTLLIKRFAQNLSVKNAGGSLCFYSVSDGYIHLYKLSDFEIISFLTVAASPSASVEITGGGENRVLTLNAKRVSSLNSYGEDDVFIIIISSL